MASETTRRRWLQGGGKVSAAALLSGVARAAGNTVAVLCGGNIDVNLLGRVVERGLLVEGRLRRVTVASANVPGALARITRAVADAGANIIEVDHETVTGDLPVGVARISLRVEVAGDEAFEELIEALLASGLVRAEATDLATPAAASMPA